MLTCHGFDESKFNGASLFYLPGQAKEPKGSFFIDYGEGNPKRGPLDLHAWIEECILNLRPDPEPGPVTYALPPAQPAATAATGSPSLQAIRDLLAAQKAQTQAGSQAARIAAMQTWQDAACTPGAGHNAFFRLGSALMRAGLDGAEIRQKLHEAASYARSPRERRAEIPGIIKSLNRRGTLKGDTR